jgi:hypothetical protein
MPILKLNRGGKAKRHFLKGSVAGHKSAGRADRVPRSKQGGGAAGPMPPRLHGFSEAVPLTRRSQNRGSSP